MFKNGVLVTSGERGAKRVVVGATLHEGISRLTRYECVCIPVSLCDMVTMVC